MTGKSSSLGLGLLILLGALSMLPDSVADVEQNDEFAAAEMTTPGTHSGRLNYSGGAGDRFDYYKFAVAEGQRFTVNGSAGPGAGVQFHMADPNQAFILESNWLAAGEYQVLNYTLGSSNAGYYYLWFEFGGGADTVANYSFELAIRDQSDAGQAGDAGDTNSTARTITPGTYDGWLDVADQFDYYVFDVPPGNRIDLAFTPAGSLRSDGRMRLELGRLDGAAFNATNWYGPGESAALTHQTSAATGGNYIADMAYMTSGGNYTLTLALVPQNDGGSNVDAAGDLDSGPYMLPGSGSYGGVLHDDDAADCYWFNVTAGQIISCNLTAGAAESDRIKYLMYRPDRTVYKDSEWFNPGESRQTGLVTNNSGAGAWFLEVKGRNTYTFSLALVGQNDGGVPGDVGDTPAASRPILPGVDYTGLLGDDDGQDFYSFDGVANSTIRVSYVFYNGYETGRITVYGPEEELVHVPPVVGPQTPTSFALTLECTGRYYLGVEAGNLEYRFNLTVTAAPAADTRPPVIVITSPGNGTTVNVSALNLSGTASDDTGVARVEASINGLAWFNATGTTGWTISGFVLPEGNNTIWARAWDGSGNRNTTSISVSYRPGPLPVNDTEKPTVKFVDPVHGFNTRDKTLRRIYGTATDNVGVASVELWFQGRPVNVTYSNGSWLARNVVLEEGRNVITVKAADAAGNVETVTITVTYEVNDPGFEALFLVAAVAVGLAVLSRRRK
jgi:hypothetical protein